MKADTVNLVKVFGADRHHVVPIFQRPYVWQQETNWAPLWTDVKAAAEEVEAERTGSPVSVDRTPRMHFLGTIVLEQLRVAPGRMMSMSVIDGQQRLTTLQVLIAACRAATREHGAASAERLFIRLLNNTEELVHQDFPRERYKVWPSFPDRDAFRDIHVPTLPPAAPDEHLLVEARRYFDGEVSTWLGQADDTLARADALVTAVRERLGLVEIQLEEDDDAQIIFETLNDRGMQLQAADLVKNTLFRLAELQGDDVSDLYARHWQDFERRYWRESITTGRIHRTRIDVLLAYWLSIRTGSEVPVERLFADFRIWLRRNDATAADLLADLAHHGRAFLRMESMPATTATGHLLEVLDILTTTTPMPLMLHLHARDGVSAQQRSIAATALESFIVRRMVCGLPANDYNRLFLQVLQNVRAEDDAVAGDRLVRVLSEQGAASRYWPDDDEVVTSLTQSMVYKALRGPRLKVLLGGIEEALRDGRSEQQLTPREAAKMTVEHLMPQKWSTFYPLPTDRSADEAEARRVRELHKLGNLTLTTGKLNTAISNGSWPTKRSALTQHTVLLLTSATVLQAPPGVPLHASASWVDTWDEDRIALRTLFLATLTTRAWPGPHADVRQAGSWRVDVAVVAPDLAAWDQQPDRATGRSTSRSAASSVRQERYSGPPRSIRAHIEEAFADVPTGTFLTISQIASFDSDEYAPDHPSQGAVSYQLRSPAWNAAATGAEPGRGGDRNSFGARKVG